MLGVLVAFALAQAPDVTDASASPSASAPREGAALASDAPRSAHLLERRIRELDLKLASVNESWPQGDTVLMFTGVSFGPLLTVLGAVMIATGAAAIPALVVPGIVVLAVGIVGVAVLVLGAWRASNASESARAERARLLEERGKLEAELDALPQASRAAPAAPLFSYSF